MASTATAGVAVTLTLPLINATSELGHRRSCMFKGCGGLELAEIDIFLVNSLRKEQCIFRVDLPR